MDGKRIMDDEEQVTDYLLDYWMYDTIKESLKEKINKTAAAYTPEAYDMFKGNKFDKLGQACLSLEKIQTIHEKHDELIKKEMNL
jgi:hypothetical protein